jgi:hypothetical protein
MLQSKHFSICSACLVTLFKLVTKVRFITDLLTIKYEHKNDQFLQYFVAMQY